VVAQEIQVMQLVELLAQQIQVAAVEQIGITQLVYLVVPEALVL
jgi:hypothetical protein